MKKKILIATSYAAVAALAVGGTMAYFTATDDAVNVMTMGAGVEIELIEQQRNDDSTALEDFEQGKELLPIVGSAQTDPKETVDGLDLTTAKNYVDKIVTVDNTGATDAYVRVIVAVPSALENTENASGPLHWNVVKNYADYYDLTWEDAPIDIEGVDYNLYTFTYKTALAGGESTEVPAFIGFYLDSAVDYDADKDCYTFKGEDIDYDMNEVLIPVQAQAMQASGFATPAEAFEASGMPSNPWADVNYSVADDEAASVGTKYAGYSPAIEGEVIEDMVVVDDTDTLNLRALYNNGLTGDLTINNSYFSGQYAMNVTAKEEAGAVLTASNTAFYGWTSYSGFASATFTNCIFGEGSEDTVGTSYNYIRAYDDTVFTNCEFKGSVFDIQCVGEAAVATITFENCTYNGEALTADMIADILDAGRSEEALASIQAAITVK